VRLTQPTPAAKCASARSQTRYGYTLLEVQVAFAVLGIGLAGLCPFVVMQLRQIRQLERRLQGHMIRTSPGTGVSQSMLQGNTYYIVPWTNVWTQKVTGSGQILTSATSSCDPGNSARGNYQITMVELDAPPYSQNVTAYVNVSAP
jgi:type II secretory pathway pseudopilin PulG